MAEGAAMIGSTVLGAVLPKLLGSEPDEPSAPPPPEVPSTDESVEASAARRLAAARRSGRQSTLLTDDYSTPVGQQISPTNIGRATLLGG